MSIEKARGILAVFKEPNVEGIDVEKLLEAAKHAAKVLRSRYVNDEFEAALDHLDSVIPDPEESSRLVEEAVRLTAEMKSLIAKDHS